MSRTRGKRGARLHVPFALFASGLFGCGAGGAPSLAPVVGPPTPSAAAFPSDDRPLLRYRSRRLAISLPLPDGHAWRIDDHSRPELVATHAATRSRVVVAVFPTTEVVGRAQCEDLARARKLIPGDDGHPLHTVADEATTTQGTFDTRVAVALQDAPEGGGALAGHVLAFGGVLRKCYVFVYSTEVDDAAEEPALAARLAVARTRVLAGLEIDRLDAVLHEPDRGPKLAPLR